MTLHKLTIEMILNYTSWWTAGQATDYLRQCGPLAFHSEKEYEDFRAASKRRQYAAVYNALMRLRGKGMVDSCLGDDRGREVRVFRLPEGVTT
jgi:hypothetical protein